MGTAWRSAQGPRGGYRRGNRPKNQSLVVPHALLPLRGAADRFAHSAGPGSLELRDDLDVWDVWDIWDVEDDEVVLDVFDDEMQGKCC